MPPFGLRRPTSKKARSSRTKPAAPNSSHSFNTFLETEWKRPTALLHTQGQVFSYLFQSLAQEVNKGMNVTVWLAQGPPWNLAKYLLTPSL